MRPTFSAFLLLIISGCGYETEPSDSIAPDLPSLASSESPRWRILRALPAGVRAAASTSDATRIYVLGGNSGSSTLTALTLIYNPGKNNWRRGADIPIALDFSQAATLSDGVHLVGGVTATGLTAGHWVYSPASNEWRTRAPIPVPVVGAVAVAIRGKLYVVGGGSANGPSGAVQIFDPASNTWSSGSPMPTARLSAAAALIEGQFYIAGGQTVNLGTTDVLERYNPQTNTWASLPRMPAPREALGGGATGGELCVFGGRLTSPNPSGNAFPETYCYSPLSNAWTRGRNMVTPRVEAASATHRNRIYSFGGRTPTAFAVTSNEALH
jgi:N-acetylneuraminic acid mutarotase